MLGMPAASEAAASASVAHQWLQGTLLAQAVAAGYTNNTMCGCQQ